MKALLGTLIMLSGVSANAGTAAYDQLVAGLYGPDCGSVMIKKLKEVVNPSWTDTFRTFGVADLEAYAIRDAVETNLKVYSDVLPVIEANLASGQSNGYIYSQINANLNKHAQESEVGAAAVACIKRTVKLGGSTTQQFSAVQVAKNFIQQVEGAVK